MYIRRQLRKWTYPILIFLGKLTGIHRKTLSGDKQPLRSFFELFAFDSKGTRFEFSGLRGKKVLIVNIASGCGYTPQLKDLQTFFEKEKDRISIIAFPSADFGNQEKLDDQGILDFCKSYHLDFPIMKKCKVNKGPDQHPVFHWLTHESENGWNQRGPGWNFCKYLISEAGELKYVFDPGISPDEIRKTL